MGSHLPRGGPAIVEPVFVPTQMVTGILPPVCTGEHFVVPIYEERVMAGGQIEWVVLHRFVLTRGNYLKAVWTAVSPVQALMNLVRLTLS